MESRLLKRRTDLLRVNDWLRPGRLCLGFAILLATARLVRSEEAGGEEPFLSHYTVGSSFFHQEKKEIET